MESLYEARYADAVKKSTNSYFASAKALADCICPFIDRERVQVDKVVVERE
jgi:hypothetical protein